MRANPNDLSRRAVLTMLTLGVLTLFALAMFAVRMVYTGQVAFRWIPWNLLLAWVPFASAYAAYRLARAEHGGMPDFARVGIIVGCLAVWLAFFPNAPYVVTDLIHWRNTSRDFLAWFDLILLLTLAVTGLLLGAVSLFLVHGIVERAMGRLGRVVGWLFAVGVCAVAGFGIYIGRFLRWNSWDIVLNPDQVLLDVYYTLRHPIANSRGLAFAALMAGLVLVVYLVVSTIAGARSDTGARNDAVRGSDTRDR